MTGAAILLAVAALLSVFSGAWWPAGILVVAAAGVFALGYSTAETKGPAIARSMLGRSGGIPGLYVPTGEDDPHVVLDRQRQARLEEIRRTSDAGDDGEPGRSAT
ncbi:hypothetical protein ACFSSC_07590 [Corynebacterium mendelii]